MTGIARVLEAWSETAEVLRRNGAPEMAKVRERMAEEVAAAEPDAVRWISEEQAMLRTGWTLTKVRRHAAQYRHSGHARRVKGKWSMLAIVVPQRVPASVLAAADRRAAQ
jgi:hypothetical protein